MDFSRITKKTVHNSSSTQETADVSALSIDEVNDMQILDYQATPLAQLLAGLCDPRAVELVLEASERGLNLYKRESVERALTEVMHAILPWPAKRVRNDFWLYPAGQQLAAAQWSMWQGEAIVQSDVARILFGDSAQPALNKVSRLTAEGVLHSYRKPDSALAGYKRNPRTGHIARAWYWRRSEVEAYKVQ
jgi:hypothetical protein